MIHQHDNADAPSIRRVHIAGQRADVAQGAGLEVCLAGNGAAPESTFQGAIGRGNGQGRFEFGEQRAPISRAQQLIQRPRADALDA